MITIIEMHFTVKQTWKKILNWLIHFSLCSVKFITSLTHSFWSYLYGHMSKACLFSNQRFRNITFNLFFDIWQFSMSWKALFLSNWLYSSCSAFSLALIDDLVKWHVKNSPLSDIILRNAAYIWPWLNAFCFFNLNSATPTFIVNICTFVLYMPKLELKETACDLYKKMKRSSY